MKKINISDIAKMAGCSKATVSLVLNNDKRVAESTRKRVLKIIKKYNFMPNYFARRLSLKNSKNTISEVVIVAPTVRSVFIRTIFSEIEEVFYKDGIFDIKFSFYTTVGKIDTKKQILQKLLYENIADLIVAITLKPDEDIIKIGKEMGVPFILIENESPHAYSILVDNKKGVNLALDYFKNTGRKNPVVVLGTTKFAKGAEPNPTAKERFEAAVSWFKENKFSLDKRFFYVSSYIYEEGYKIVDEIISSNPKVDAIFCAAGDEVASGILERLKEKNIKIPQQVAIIGYDNYKLICENTEPKLTTVDQKLNTIARYVYQIIMSIKVEKNLKRIYKVSPELVIRNSA